MSNSSQVLDSSLAVPRPALGSSAVSMAAVPSPALSDAGPSDSPLSSATLPSSLGLDSVAANWAGIAEESWQANNYGAAEYARLKLPWPPKRVVSVVLALSVLIAMATLGVTQVVKSSLRREIGHKQLEPIHTTLASTRSEEQKNLSHYQWVNRSEGIVRIPVTRARELVLKEYLSQRTAPGASAASTSSVAALPRAQPDAPVPPPAQAAIGSGIRTLPENQSSRSQVPTFSARPASDARQPGGSETAWDRSPPL